MVFRLAENKKQKCFRDPKKIIESADSNGFVSGKYIEQNKQTDVNKYNKKIEEEQDAILHIFVA